MVKSTDVVVKIAEALLIDYTAIFFVKAVTNEFTWFSIDPEHHTLVEESDGDDFFHYIKAISKMYVYDEDRHVLMNDIQKENLIVSMSRGSMQNMKLRIMIDGKPVWHSIRLLRGDTCFNDYFIVGLLNIDNEVKRDQENDAFSQIAEKLANHYNTIFYVEVDTDRYIEFSSTNLYHVLDVPPEGDKFFAESLFQTHRVIYEEDRERILQVFDKENLMRLLEQKPFVYVDYRIMVHDELLYVRMTAMYTKDKKHFMFCVEDRNEEMETVRKLEEAKLLAVRDELTGVKNKNAYQSAAEELSLLIRKKENPPFAVVVTDVNNLKLVNDEFGHAVGDDYIKDSCRLICFTFKHSPVFRIGGDEFAVILKGNDYENRNGLIENMKHAALDNLKAGNAPVLAVGISDFIPGADKCVEDVFKRADAKMYINKNDLKSL